MNFYKRIISLFLIFAICISSMVTVASAADERTVPPGFTPADFATAASYGAAIDTSLGYLLGVDGYLGTLREAMTSGSCDGCPVNPDGRHNFMPVEILSASWAAALRGSDAVVCRYCGITYNEFYSQMYNSYLDDLKSDLGSTVLANGMIRIPYPSYSGSATQLTSIYRVVDMPTNPLGRYSSVYMQFVSQKSDGTISTSYSFAWTGNEKQLSLPYDAYVTGGYTTWGNANVVLNSGLELLSNQLIYAGNKFGMCTNGGAAYLNATVPSKVTFCDFGAMLYVDVLPVSGLSSVTGQDISINSRPTTIIGDYGIIGDDGTIIHVEGNVIVDESTNTVYNPVTNTTNNYNEYEFDYSDRSYNLTLEDGSTLRVVYGDENITIEEGDTVYNIYYLIPNTPGGDSGDDPGTGDVPGGGDWSWWKKAWQEFTDKLFGILGNGSTVNPDNVPSVPGDEESGDEGYTIIDLFVVLKDGTWAFITGIVGTAYDGFTSFVESVISAGSFFTFYDEESDEGILFIPLENGETIWD